MFKKKYFDKPKILCLPTTKENKVSVLLRSSPTVLCLRLSSYWIIGGYFSFSCHQLYIHYAPLMMSQKVIHRKHTCVLPKKVACLVRVTNSMLLGNDMCFLGATFYQYYTIRSKYQEAHRKHTERVKLALKERVCASCVLPTTYY